MALPGMGDQKRRVLLEDPRERDHLYVLLHEIERHERIRRDVEVEDAGREQLRMVHLRPARPQFHIEAVLLINAGRDRLVKTAMLGLGLPIRTEIDSLGGSRARERQTGA